MQVWYYHILANDMVEAIAIAKDNPEFEFVSSASIGLRPIVYYLVRLFEIVNFCFSDYREAF